MNVAVCACADRGDCGGWLAVFNVESDALGLYAVGVTLCARHYLVLLHLGSTLEYLFDVQRRHPHADQAEE